MKIIGLAAVAAALALSAPARADVLGDYDVYAATSVTIAGGVYGAIGSSSFNNGNGANGTNYSSWNTASAGLAADAIALSASLRGMAATGALTTGTFTPGAGTLTGTGSGTNVFNLTGSQYASLYSLVFAGPGTGAIVNVGGLGQSGFVNMNFGNLLARNVVFNFHGATSLSMSGMNIRGTILAPSAAVSLSGGSVAGDVMSRSFVSAGTTIGGTGFAGLAAAAVPEPSTWGLMLVGFAAVGGAMRRRRSATGQARIA